MSKHPGDDGQRNASGHGLARHGMAQVVKAHVLDARLAAHPIPERMVRAARARRVARGGKHERAACLRLPIENGSCLAAQSNRPRPRFAVGKCQHVIVNLGPAQACDLAPAASGEQKKADDVGLLPATRAGLSVQDAGQARDLLAGQEPCQRRAAVSCDAAGRVGVYVAAGDGEIHDLAENIEGAVGAARRGPAVAVEPSPDMRGGDVVERFRPEGGKQLSL